MRRFLLSSALLVIMFLGIPASPALAAVPCPASSTFPFAIPGGVVPGTGLAPIVGAIVTSETGTFPICRGSFVVRASGPTGPVVVASGKFKAVHSGGDVSARFEGALASGAIEFEGKLSFSGSTGAGRVTAEFELPTGTEVRVTLAFACSAAGCLPVGAPIVSTEDD